MKTHIYLLIYALSLQTAGSKKPKKSLILKLMICAGVNRMKAQKNK
jgi:hypothetical protein